MSTTRPISEQIRFVSSKTGTHVLDDYLEAIEQGSRTVGDMLEDLYDTSTGSLRQDVFNVRVQNGYLQTYMGDLIGDPTWQNSAVFFRDRGTFSTSATYQNLDIVTTSGTTYLVTSDSPGTFASEALFLAEGYPTLPNAEPYQSGYATRADLVTAVAGGLTPPDNSIVFANGFAYIKTNNSSNLPGLADYEPYGPIYPDHFADNTTPGTTDMLSAIQAAIEHIKGTDPYGGGTVHFTKGIYAVSAKIVVYSNISLKGEGMTLTVIRALNSATFASNEAVIQSENFSTLTGTNVWIYNSPYPTGLCMGFQIDGLTIDANNANVANAGGLYIYGGKWLFGAIGVINCAGHGIWTECGVATAFPGVDDYHQFLNMHESTARDVYISETDQHGWYFRGPNTTNINNLQVRNPNWAGFYQDDDAAISTGNLSIDSLYVLLAQCAHNSDGEAVYLSSGSFNFIYSLRSERNGVRFANGTCFVGNLYIRRNNPSSTGNFYGVRIESETTIDTLNYLEEDARTSGSNSGAVDINAVTEINNAIIQRDTSSTLANEIGVYVNARTRIGYVDIRDYDSTGNIGLQLNNAAANITMRAANCATGLEYAAAGNNVINFQGASNTTDVTYTSTPNANDTIRVNSNITARGTIEVGKLKGTNLNLDIQNVSPATASITHDLNDDSVYRHRGLTTSPTVNAPVNPSDGDVLTLIFQQDATGGRTITFNSVFKTTYSNTGNTSNNVCVLSFIYDATSSDWVELSNTGWH